MKNKDLQKNTFLHKLAKDISIMPKTDLLCLRIIFTNRRAIKYFKEEYKSLQEGVFSMPECETINDFVQSHSPYKQAEELSLIYMLYCSYQKIYYSRNPLSEDEEAESFENFYFWGKTILNDFDDIDKNLADAKKLYTTLSEEKEIEELFDFLSDEQKNVLSQYFADFKKLYSSDSKLKNNFVKIWNCLSDIYFDYKEELKKNAIAYSGMMYRDLVERMSESDNLFEDDIFAFAGFNVLNQSEKKLFECIKSTNTAHFYWDYDTYYTENSFQEAGIFMRENLSKFPCNKTFSENDFSQIEKSDCNYHIISTTYETTQVHYIRTWIKSLEKQYGESLKQNQIAIILLNENLLPYVLKALPNQVNGQETKVNITMGYPFKFSTLFEEIGKFAENLSEEGMTHAEQIDGLIRLLKDKAMEKNCPNETKEAAFRSIVTLEDFKATLDFIAVPLSENFVRKTLLKLLQKQIMPFESDATDGIQVMGLLESRNLDFRHILMLSTTNSNVPAVSNAATFIPHSLRNVFNLMTEKRKIAVFAYYFYRLLHNAKSITYIYNTHSASNDNEEMSCFLQQLRLELGKSIKVSNLSNIQSKSEIKIELPAKTKATIENVILKKEYLPPSYINTYIDCPLKFYYDKICELKAIKEEKDIISLSFGNLFHHSAEFFEESNRTKSLKTCIEEGLDKLDKDQKASIKQMHKDIVLSYLEDLKTFDDKNKDREFVSAEEEIVRTKNINGKDISFGGRIDRIDEKNKRLILCDYKTGGKDEKDQGIEELFDSNNKDRAKYLFQIMFYAWLLWKEQDIDVEIMYVHLLKSKDYENKIYTYNAETHEIFDECMNEIIKKLLDTDETKVWEANTKSKNCEYCDYQTLCPNNEIENEDDTI